MAEKLSWTELRRALAVRAGVSEKKAGVFLNALTAQLLEGLKSDKQVKINGLGTFKLQAVAPRKSVDVSTGAEIIIDGYNKVVFAPEAGVKEMVESLQPSEVTIASSEPVDPIQKLGAQAEEIVGILGELGQSPVEEESVSPIPVVEEPKEPEPVVIPEPIIEPAKEPVVVQEPIVETPTIEPEPIVVPPTFVPEPTPITKEPEVVEQPKKKKKKYHFVRDTIICVLILLLLVGGCYFFLRDRISGWVVSLMQRKPAQTEQVAAIAMDTLSNEDMNAAQEALIPEGDISQAQILAEFLAASDELDIEDPTERYPDLITIEPMHEGSRLTWMAKRFYGNKRYWPYLYDANKDCIFNPNNIDVGTPIRVPRLTAEQLDTTIESTRQNLERLREEAEEACRR